MAYSTLASAKRPRTSSSSSSLTPSEPTQPQEDVNPPFKASRIVPLTTISSSESGQTDAVVNHPILCNLPPTCSHKPTPIADTNELEKHYAKYHAHVCEVGRCGCVFPEARLLELHQTECHDPIAALRKDRGEKIFECHVPAPTCGRSFLTPKARRLHLIQAHAFPKEYFFAVTNKGVGGLLKKWGEGASLVRKEWKPRSKQQRDGANVHREDARMDEDEEEEDSEEQDEDDEILDEDEDTRDLDATPRMQPRRITSPGSSDRTHSNHTPHDNAGVAALTDSLNSLSLVPNSVRFGRGGKTSGFAPNNQVRGGKRGRGKPQTRGASHTAQYQTMEVDPVPEAGPPGRRTGNDLGRSTINSTFVPPIIRGRGVPNRARGRARGRGRGA
ncbi:unnamed protein product [Cyclocybe aegerita]|uniref:C2H2-type domain-containing protein n=1 Tax=Cyclocybe aegerita TaxID=1973307 RepID=A0A8S0WZ02_CYCAE|nr:unnamed protein product [Cyclocybe aegerita]